MRRQRAKTGTRIKGIRADEKQKRTKADSPAARKDDNSGGRR
jgi:hypothetical protein